MENRKLTFKQVRDMFFDDYPQFKEERRFRKPQNEFSTECRCYFCDYVEYLRVYGLISDSQAHRITLIG